MKRIDFAPRSLCLAVLILFSVCGGIANGQCEIRSVAPKGSVDIPDMPYEVAISGSYAYVAAYDAGLQIVDISNSEEPRTVGSLPLSRAKGVAVSGSYAYITGADFTIVDVSNPASPFATGKLEDMWANNVAVSGSYAYVARGYGGLKVVDISNPSSPETVGALEAADLCANDVFVSGAYAYVADLYSRLRIVDISDPANPFIVGTAQTSHQAWGVEVSGTYAYVCTQEMLGGALEVFDISEPASPYLVGSVSPPGWNWTLSIIKVSIVGDYAYAVAGSVLVIDISEPALPYIVSLISLEELAMDIEVVGSTAYAICHSWNDDETGALQVLDVSHPLSLPVVHTLESLEGSSCLEASDDYVYIGTSSQTASLQILDISDAAAPVIIGSTGLPYPPVEDIALAGPYAYLAAGELEIVDSSDPTAPFIVGSLMPRVRFRA